MPYQRGGRHKHAALRQSIDELAASHSNNREETCREQDSKGMTVLTGAEGGG